MKALSVIQPWASLIILGAKRFETRSWQTSYRGPLLIHSSKKLPPSSQGLCYEEPFKTALAPLLLPYSPHQAPNGNPWELPIGCLLGVVDLQQCIETEEIACSDEELVFGDFQPGRWGWRVEVLQRFKQPIPIAGHLGLWDVPPGILELSLNAEVIRAIK